MTDKPHVVPKEKATWASIGVAILGGVFGAGSEVASPEFFGAILVVISGLIGVFKRGK